MAQAAISVRSPTVGAWTALAITLAPATASSQIAFDNALAGSFTAGATHTVAFTVGVAANYLLAGIVVVNATDILTGVTYNAVALTRLAVFNAGLTTGWIYIYGLANPTVGANNLVATCSGATVVAAHMASYTNASGTQPNSTVSASALSSALIWTISTPTIPGCWGVQFSRSSLGAVTMVAIGGTMRTTQLTDGVGSFVDTNGVIQLPTPVTLNANRTGWVLERIDLKPSQGERS